MSSQLRKLSYKIINSTTKLLPAWKAALDDARMAVRNMLHDVATPWNSTFDMLEFALQYQKPLRRITGQLCDVLKVLKDATLFFSRGTPNLATVIPAMDHIDSKFATDALNMAFKPSIHSSLFLAKKTLNRYYDMTDHSEVCHIAMVLHPRYKLSYFRNAGWDSEWIEAV
ncbi:hypothetical protein FIBSPDRAFT_962382 [Athelia psychrophila]|uniref:hAT-like transposase RNase-H fold domain-containing protein n=1 Tax=Athelia psychrophila TaxID=1759441 RepID=A0A166A639_9AGAM|nr:hypothetical protein FIBSPDRAFT_962382 [Fibularhizoctonia sp. CBS 109695]